MSYLDKYQLPKTSKKILCPNCGKKTFKPYVDAETGIPVNESLFGRCDRENECGYHNRPDIKRTTNETLVQKIIFPGNEILSEFKKTRSNLHDFLISKGIPEEYLYNDVLTGTYKTKSGRILDGLTIYVFRNHAGNICNVKYFKYQTNGKRDHDFKAFSLSNPEQRNKYIEEKYTMPLFGEHELDPEKRRIVCVVESEKTKLLAKFHYPEFDWVACGSANGLSDGSEGSADKITPLKGRTVYWVCDADKASRGKTVIDERTNKEVWQWCSSVRNGIKHIDNFCVVDLFPNRDDGYDIGDAILDGLKPVIAPTWSKKFQDKKYKSYVPPGNWAEHEKLAKQVGETTGISEEFDAIYSWMRTHVNAHYGWSNDGKGTMLDLLSLIKAVKSGWKSCMFKQEDMGASYNNGNSKITADKIYAKLVWSYTGKVPPAFEMFAKKNNCPMLTKDEYLVALEWVKSKMFMVYPEDRKYRNILDEFLYFYEVFGIDHFVIDPWNVVILDDIERGDERLIKAFISCKEFVLRTNTVLSIVNHAGSRHEVKEKSGAFRVVNQFMQLGGSAWDIKMDGQFSIHRPLRHKRANDPTVNLWNLKQRDSESVGAQRGVYKEIEFDRNKRQYYFNGLNPISGEVRVPGTQQQAEIEYVPSWRRKKKQTFEEHMQQDWQAPSDSDVPEWVK